MRVDIEEGLLYPADWCGSPNYDERPDPSVIDMLVIHNISLPPGQFGGIEIDQFFQNKLDHSAHPFFSQLQGVRVSAHLLLRRDGSFTQYVPFHKRAWHAGVSYFHGQENCNDFSIGIELEGTDDLPYEDIQYDHLTRVVGVLRQSYPRITFDRIIGHCDIAPERKTDPGSAFNWPRFRETLLQEG